MPVKLSYKPDQGEVEEELFPADSSPLEVRVIPGQGSLTFVGKGKVVNITTPKKWSLASDTTGETPVEKPDSPRSEAEMGTLMVDTEDLAVLHHVLASPLHDDIYAPGSASTKTRNALLRKVSRLQESVKKPKTVKKPQEGEENS